MGKKDKELELEPLGTEDEKTEKKKKVPLVLSKVNQKVVAEEYENVKHPEVVPKGGHRPSFQGIHSQWSRYTRNVNRQMNTMIPRNVDDEGIEAFKNVDSFRQYAYDNETNLYAHERLPPFKLKETQSDEDLLSFFPKHSQKYAWEHFGKKGKTFVEPEDVHELFPIDKAADEAEAPIHRKAVEEDEEEITIGEDAPKPKKHAKKPPPKKPEPKKEEPKKEEPKKEEPKKEEPKKEEPKKEEPKKEEPKKEEPKKEEPKKEEPKKEEPKKEEPKKEEIKPKEEEPKKEEPKKEETKKEKKEKKHKEKKEKKKEKEKEKEEEKPKSKKKEKKVKIKEDKPKSKPKKCKPKVKECRCSSPIIYCDCDKSAGDGGDKRKKKYRNESEDEEKSYNKSQGLPCLSSHQDLNVYNVQTHPHGASAAKKVFDEDEEGIDFTFRPITGHATEFEVVIEPDEEDPLAYAIDHGVAPVVCSTLPSVMMNSNTCYNNPYDYTTAPTVYGNIPQMYQQQNPYYYPSQQPNYYYNNYPNYGGYQPQQWQYR